MRTSPIALLGAAVLTALAGCGGGTEEPAVERPLNLVVVVLDTLRADHLGLYGYERDTSPHLDAFARESFVFERAESAAPWTAPSLVSLVTSLYPEVHGVRGFPNPRRMSDDVVTLAEVLRRHGYATAAFTEGGYAKGDFGLDQGFDSFPRKRGRRRVPDSHLFFPSRLEGNIARSLRWLREHGEEPFFLFFQTYEPHMPVSRAGGVRSPLPTAIRRAQRAQTGAADHRALEPWASGRPCRLAALPEAYPSVSGWRSSSARRPSGVRAGESRPGTGPGSGVPEQVLPGVGA